MQVNALSKFVLESSDFSNNALYLRVRVPLRKTATNPKVGNKATGF